MNMKLIEELREFESAFLIKGSMTQSALNKIITHHSTPTPTEDGSSLPEGRTCWSCLHTNKCKQLGIYNRDSVVCDWNPCRYAEFHGDMTPEPMFMREVCESLGWQGGTVHEVIKEIKRLKATPTPEPLAVLADRKNIRQIQIWPLMSGVWEIDLELRTRDRKEIFVENGYAAAEQAARAYLEKLEDKGVGK